jgi:4'-phosphopantetheinyl transferase EntD
MDSTAVLAASPARELLAWIADGAEVRCLRAVADWPLPEATAALFAVKEAFYKAVCTPDPRAMEFDAVRLVAVDRSAPDLWHLRLQANGPWLHVGADGPMCTAHVRTTRRADAPVEQHAAVWWG